MGKKVFKCKEIKGAAERFCKRSDTTSSDFCVRGIPCFLQVLRSFSGRYCIIVIFLLLTSHLLFAGGKVYWTPNGIMISNTRAAPSDIVSDGAGGAIVILDGSAITDSIYAQRVDGNGNLLWGATGAVVTGNSYIGSNGAKAVSDGKGGVIVVWERYSSLTYLNLFCQRLDSTGARMWNPAGVLICDADSDQWHPRLFLMVLVGQ